MRKFFPPAYLIPAALLVALLSVQFLSASPVLAEDKQATACCGKRCGEGDKDWQAWHEQKLAEMAERDARLDTLVAEMNEASGDEKVEAMAAVISEMIAQRKERHERYAERKKSKGAYMHGECKGQACGKCPACPGMQTESKEGGE